MQPLVLRLPVLLAAALATTVFAGPASAQRGRVAPRARPTADGRIAVAIIPVQSSPDDSIATIIARDLEFGDRVRVLPFDSTARLSTVIRPVLSPDALTVSLLDAASGAVRQERAFPLPVVPTPRDSMLTDSVAQALAGRAIERGTVLTRYAVIRDSLETEQAKKPGRLRTTRDRADHARAVATRDSLLQLTHASDSTTRADAARDSIGAAASLARMLARDASARDSTARERHWAIHGVADELQQWLTGQRGVAQSRIAYVAGGHVRVIDFDGGNDHAVTSTGDALSPAWRHDGRAIVYSDLNDSGTQIVSIDLGSGAATTLSATKRGLNITPVFSPDDRQIYFATSDGNHTQLVGASTDSAVPLLRVTAALPFDCSSPAFSPDGERIAFVSPRPNLPQIYSVSIQGLGDRLETPRSGRGRSYRTSPDWSPDGRSIAFQQQDGRFQIWTVSLPDHHFHKLTSTGENEDPSWAPDARHIALTSSRFGRKEIWILDTQTGRLRPLTHVGGARLAAWSPLLSTSG